MPVGNFSKPALDVPRNQLTDMSVLGKSHRMLKKAKRVY